MAIGRDWAVDAVEEILEGLDEVHLTDENMPETRARMLSILHERSPFKPDVAYMEVPRCDACRHWRPMGLVSPGEIGVCSRLVSLDDPAQPVCARSRAPWDPEPDDSAQLRTHKDFGCVQWEAR